MKPIYIILLFACAWSAGFIALCILGRRLDKIKRLRRHARIMALRLHEDLPGENDTSWMVVNSNGSLEEIMLPV